MLSLSTGGWGEKTPFLTNVIPGFLSLSAPQISVFLSGSSGCHTAHSCRGEGQFGLHRVLLPSNTPLVQDWIFITLSMESSGEEGSHPAPCPAWGPGCMELSWLRGCMCMCVCMHVYACVVCAHSRCSPSLLASSAQFCRLQQNKVSSPAAGRPPRRSPQLLHSQHSPSAGRDR